MQSLNKVQIIGFLPRNPEMRYTANGVPVTSFTAVSLRPWVDVKADHGKKSPEYMNVVAWNKLAEICNQLLGVGSKVFVEGRIQTKTWSDEQGGRRYRTEIVAEDMVVLGDKQDDSFDIMEQDAEQTLNRAQIIGNLTRDPEKRQLPSGTLLTTFGVATNRAWVSSDGARQESVEYHNVISWNSRANFVAEELKKGMKVFIEGRLQNRTWETPEGAKQTRTEIVADAIILSTRLPASASGDFSYSSNQQDHTYSNAIPPEEYDDVFDTSGYIGNAVPVADDSSNQDVDSPGSSKQGYKDDLPF